VTVVVTDSAATVATTATVGAAGAAFAARIGHMSIGPRMAAIFRGPPH